MHGITVFGLLHIPEQFVPIAASALVFILAIIIAIIIRKTYRNENSYLPSSKLSVTNIFEVIIEGMGNFYESILGKHTPEFLSLLLSYFIYILISNLIGLIPGVVGPTNNMTINAVMAIMVFVFYNFIGLKKHGFHYLKTFMGPMVWLAFLMIPVEIMTHLARPLSLTLRLTGNISGEHLVMGIISGLVPLIVPVAFLFMGFLTAVVQSLVFTTLSAIYVLLSIDIDH